nr:hypothetical protein B0A51_04281 [Rachicladosporium sp. CCFEE 5018]
MTETVSFFDVRGQAIANARLLSRAVLPKRSIQLEKFDPIFDIVLVRSTEKYRAVVVWQEMSKLRAWHQFLAGPGHSTPKGALHLLLQESVRLLMKCDSWSAPNLLNAEMMSVQGDSWLAMDSEIARRPVWNQATGRAFDGGPPYDIGHFSPYMNPGACLAFGLPRSGKGLFRRKSQYFPAEPSTGIVLHPDMPDIWPCAMSDMPMINVTEPRTVVTDLTDIAMANSEAGDTGIADTSTSRIENLTNRISNPGIDAMVTTDTSSADSSAGDSDAHSFYTSPQSWAQIVRSIGSARRA